MNKNPNKNSLKSLMAFCREIFPRPTLLLTIKDPDKMKGNIKIAYFLWLYNQSWFMMVMPLLIILWSTTLFVVIQQIDGRPD